MQIISMFINEYETICKQISYPIKKNRYNSEKILWHLGYSSKILSQKGASNYFCPFVWGARGHKVHDIWSGSTAACYPLPKKGVTCPLYFGLCHSYLHTGIFNKHNTIQYHKIKAFSVSYFPNNTLLLINVFNWQFITV